MIHINRKEMTIVSSVRISLEFAILLSLLVSTVQSLSMPKKNNKQFNTRREYLKRTLSVAPLLIPTISNAETDQGISAVTDSNLGQAFRKSIVQGAQVADKLDAKWERFSDNLRDKGRCDPATGRRLYDNGTRKDGTPIGNPGLGELCSPDPIQPLDMDMTQTIINLAVKSALVASSGGSADELNKLIQQNKELVKPSFDRSLKGMNTEDEKNRGIYKFELYSTLRSITTFLNKDKAKLKQFSIVWGNELVSTFAPSASKKDFTSPFKRKEEYEDFDYDYDILLDALGKLTVTLEKLKAGGLIGFYEISIPYDDYGSVVTVAMDDYSSIGTQILLQEQSYDIDAEAQAIARSLFKQAHIKFDTLNTFFMDTFYKDPVNYDPTQLLLSVNGLTKM